jgi:hypothetical protein
MDDPEPNYPHWRHRPERSSVPDVFKFIVAMLGFLSIFFTIFFICQCFCLLCRKCKGKPDPPRPESPPKVETFKEEEIEEEHVFGPEIDCRDKDFIIYIDEDELWQMLMDSNNCKQMR